MVMFFKGKSGSVETMAPEIGVEYNGHKQ